MDKAVTTAGRLSTKWVIPGVAGLALIVGIVIGRGFDSGRAVSAATTDVQATVTRQAELVEISRMQTEVAAACTPDATATPAGSPTPEPTVEPVAMGDAVAYGDSWTIAATSISPVLPPDDPQPEGQYVKVSLTLANSGQSAIPPFAELRLVDASGNAHQIDPVATGVLVGRDWSLPIDGGASAERSLIFDVPIDAGNAFVLESTKDPSFRLALTIEARG